MSSSRNDLFARSERLIARERRLQAQWLGLGDLAVADDEEA